MPAFAHPWRRFAGGLALLVVLVAGLASVMSFGLRASRANDPRPEVLPPHRGVAVVAVLRESGGWSLFGVRIADTTRHVEVRFLSDPACSPLLRPGDRWPTSFPQCPSPVEVAGTVGAIGVVPSGDTLVGVDFDVPRACFDVLERGMEWPNNDAACQLTPRCGRCATVVTTVGM